MWFEIRYKFIGQHIGVPIENQCVKGGGLLYGGLILKVSTEEVLPRRLEGGIKDFSRLATG